MRDSLRHAVAEFIGTFALVFVGGGAIMLQRASSTSTGLLEIALAHGVILAVMVSATMRVSGHLNPAVTVGFLVTRRIEPMMGGIYIAAQIIGALAAAYLLNDVARSALPPAAYQAFQAGRLVIASDVGSGHAYLLEAIATFFLVFVVFGTAVDPEAPKIGGLAIGLTVTADILAIGPLTGAAMNPARALGPAVVFGNYEGLLVYWIGPILGAVAAALVYDFLFLPRRIEPAAHGRIDVNPQRQA